MPTIEQPKKSHWKLVVVLIVLVLITLATIAIVRNIGSDSNERPEGSALLTHSGRVVEPPEGYEFISEAQLELDNTNHYTFSRIDTSNETDVHTIVVVEYANGSADNADGVRGFTPVSNDETEAKVETLEFIAAREQSRQDFSNYDYSLMEANNAQLLFRSFDKGFQNIQDQPPISTTRLSIIGSDRDSNRIDIEVSAALESDHAIFEHFLDQL